MGRLGDGAKGRPGGERTGDEPAHDGIHNTVARTRYLAPADIVAIAYLVIIAALILIFRYRIDVWHWLLAAHAVGIGFVFLISWLDRSRRMDSSPSRPITPSPRLPFVSFIHGWYPVALIPITFKELTYLIPKVHPRDFDSALAAIDYQVFRAHPTVWLERFTWPPLTELLQICYPTYYFLPIILGGFIWRSGKTERFRFWVFVVTIAFYLSYLGYVAVPAIGPRFLPEILEAQTKPLTGLLFFETVRETLNRAEGLTRDCFPSGHTEITLVAVYYAWRFHRKTFRFFLPLGAAIVLSTVYLRYHYVVDVVAGALLAGVVILTARHIFRFFGGDDRAALDL